MKVVFWSCLALVLYIYIGYPILVYVLARLRKNFVDKRPLEPTVTVVIAAYNEEKHIGATIANKLSLDYPSDKLEILVISDESSDCTDNIVADHVGRTNGRVRLFRQSPRNGKTSALNLAVPTARGEVVVFSDANSIYERGALRALVDNFADARVGYVTGNMLYTNPDGAPVGDGSSGFMKYESFIRLQETQVGSVVGVDGGIDAIRRELYVQMRADQLPDFVLPLMVVERGYRVVYEPRAHLMEDASANASDEYRMRVRVALRALWAMYDMRRIFNPCKYGIYSWQLLSHKALRYVAFIPLVLLFVSNLFLLATAGAVTYQVVMVGQAGIYALALAGSLFERFGVKSTATTFAYYFTVLNVASAHAVAKFIGGKKQTLWRPRTG